MDIPTHSHLELELARKRQELARLSHLSMLGEMAGVIAHELNQPLAAMLNNSQVGHDMIQSGKVDMVELAAILEDIAADTKRADGIIHCMRTHFKRDAEMNMQPVNLNETIREVCELLHNEMAAEGVRVETRLALDLPLVIASSSEVQVVLANLIRNSLEAIRGANCTDARIHFSTRCQDDSVLIEVRDSGPGLSLDMQKRLFEAFATSKSGHSGLGLVTSRSILRLFEGTLTGDNHPEGGAVFRITLPSVPPFNVRCHKMDD